MPDDPEVTALTSEVSDEEIGSDLDLLDGELPQEQDTDVPLNVEDGSDDEVVTKKEEEKKESKKEPAGLLADVKEKYPEIFKEFPELRKAIFHEKEFLKLFATVDEAKEAKEKSSNFDFLESQILSGDSEALIDSLTEADSEAVGRFSRSFLPTLYKKNREVYISIIDPIIQNIIRSTYVEGEKSNNNNLKNSAWHFSKFIFGTEKFATEDNARQLQVDPERTKFENEKKEFFERRFKEAQSVVESEIDKKMREWAAQGLDGVSPTAKKLIGDAVIREVDGILAKDQNHLTTVKGLWKKASNSGFSPEIIARISSTYLARAKDLVPTIKNKYKAELVPQKNSKTDEKSQPSSGDKSKSSKGPIDPKLVDFRNTSDEDLIAGKFTPRK